MPYVCGLDCNLVRNDSQTSEKNPVSRIFVGWKKTYHWKKIIYAGPTGQMRQCLRISILFWGGVGGGGLIFLELRKMPNGTFSQELVIKIYFWLTLIWFFSCSVSCLRASSSVLILTGYNRNYHLKIHNNTSCQKKSTCSMTIALDKALFFNQRVSIFFLIFLRKHMLWVLIRSASPRCF